MLETMASSPFVRSRPFRRGLDGLLAEAARRWGCRCELLAPPPPMQATARAVLLRSLEEALSELGREARGRTIEVAVAPGDGTLTLTVRRGFEVLVVDVVAS